MSVCLDSALHEFVHLSEWCIRFAEVNDNNCFACMPQIESERGRSVPRSQQLFLHKLRNHFLPNVPTFYSRFHAQINIRSYFLPFRACFRAIWIGYCHFYQNVCLSSFTSEKKQFFNANLKLLRMSYRIWRYGTVLERAAFALLFQRVKDAREGERKRAYEGERKKREGPFIIPDLQNTSCIFCSVFFVCIFQVFCFLQRWA